MPRRAAASLIVVSLLAFWQSGAAQQSSQPAQPSVSPQRALLNRYCVTCHNEKLRTADLLLDKADVDNVAGNPEIWEKVARKLRAGQMPPLGAPRPDKAAYDGFATYLEDALDRAGGAHPNPGRPTIHRLNRVEYANAIRDLVSVEVDAASLLPADDSGRGFDNLADLLVVSPLLMERYLSAAAKISRTAIGDPSVGPTSETYRLPLQSMQEDRESDELPFGSRGGLAVHHQFPVDGEYTLQVRLARSGDGYIRGIRGDPHRIDVRLNWEKIGSFTIGGVNIGASGPLYPRNGTFYRGDPRQIEYEFNADENFTVRFPAKAGDGLVQVAFVKQDAEPDGMRLPEPMYVDVQDFKGGDPAIESITITGPFNSKGTADTPSRRKIFICTPANKADEQPCARRILSALARRAYRRPVADKEIEGLLDVYAKARAEAGFDEAVGTALQAILVSPKFLFRMERDPANIAADTAYRISDLELASRLSFFLWSSIPDDELLDLAERGKLKDSEVLQSQVKRMLADARSHALVENFAGQWLYLRNLSQVTPDPDVYPEFDEELRRSLRKETELLFESMLKQDRPVADLLDADYTFLNERLARHYGIPGIYGSEFRKVALADPNRRGLLGQGSILTVTSHANRTSPVLRGKWVLNNLLGTPPPPPPPDVPVLDEKGEQAKTQTMRQRMEAHRANPACASCHKLMDPIGFSLDNFDGIGRWRTLESNHPIDASGTLYDGTKFNGPAEFREALKQRRAQFVRTVAEKLLTYALGREVEYYDGPAVRKILRDSGGGDTRWSALILNITRSVPFQMRRSRPS